MYKTTFHGMWKKREKDLNIHGPALSNKLSGSDTSLFESPTGSTVVRNRFIYDALWTERQSGVRFLLIRRLCGHRKRRMKTAADTNMYAPLLLLFWGSEKKERERDKEENWPAPSWQWSAFHGQQKRGNAASARQVVRAREIWLCTLGLSCKKPLVVSIWAAFYRCSCRCRLLRCYQRHLWDFLNFQ